MNYSPLSGAADASDVSPEHLANGAMTFEEFCRWARVGRTKAYDEAKSGRLKLRKVGAKTIVLRDEAEAWLRALPVAA